MPTPRDPEPVQNTAELISGGFLHEIPPSQDSTIRGGGPSSTSQISGDLAGLDGVTPGSYNLDDLYSSSLQKVLGLNIGYSADPTGDPYYGFDKPARWGTGRAWVDDYYKHPVEWNAVLKLSGYYRGKEDPRLGLKADSYLNAFGQLLTDAAVSKKTITDLLGGSFESYIDLINSGKVSLSALAKGGRGGRAAPKQPIRYSSPEDLKEQARAAALDTIGYVPDDDFLADFVKLYHGLEGGFQKKMYAGASANEPGNPQVRAQKELREEYETEASSFSTVKAFDQFLSIIGADRGVAGGSQ